MVRARYARRIGRAHASAKWGPRQKGRSDVVGKLVAAGHKVRAWPIAADPPIFDEETGMLLHPVYRYTGGPCAGLPVVDPWELAAKVAWCGVRGVAAPTSGGIHASVTASPERCGLVHICPVCASAAGTGDALRIVSFSSRPTRTGALVLLTLTHRDGPPGSETLVEAWERFEDALGLFRVRIRDYLAAGKLTLETTDGEAHLTTHPHFHGVFELHPWITVEDFREFAAKLWIECTRIAGGGRVIDQARDEARQARDEAERRAGVLARATVRASAACDRAARHPTWTRERDAARAADRVMTARRGELAAAVAAAASATADVVAVEGLAIQPWDRASGWTKETKKRAAHEGWCDEIAPATGERCSAEGDDDCDGWTLLHYDACTGDDCGDGYGWVFMVDVCGGVPEAPTCAGVRCERDTWDLPLDPPALVDATDPAEVATWATAMDAWHAGPRAEWASGQRSCTIALDGAADTAIRDRAFQASKYPCPIADIVDPARVAEFVTWAASKHLVRWWGEWSGSEAQAWAKAVVQYDGDESRRLARLEGDAPDVGWRLPGVKPTTLPEPVEPERERTQNPTEAQVTRGPASGALSALGDDSILFEVPSNGMHLYRLANELRRFEAWSTMAGIMHRLDPVVRDCFSEAAYHELLQRFRAWRLREDIPAAVAEWEAARVELELDQWTEAALNGRDHKRAELAAIEAGLPPPLSPLRPRPLTDEDRARIRAAVASSYDASGRW